MLFSLESPKFNGVSSFVAADTGAVITGASFTAEISINTVAVSVRSWKVSPL